MDNELTDKELEQLKVIMERLEAEAYAPIKHVNLSFAECKMFDYDDEYIDIELTFGVQVTGEYTEQFKVIRETMKLKDE